MRHSSRRAVAALRRSFTIDRLEARTLLAGEVLSYHNDPANTGQNLTETVLTPANVNTTSFGKRFTTQLDGQVFAQALYKTNVNITRGANQGIHNVIFAATERDSLYALDADTGVILWQDSFLNVTDPTNLTKTLGVTPVPAYSGNNDVGSSLVAPDIGITSTPVIDPATNIIYVCPKTKERRNGTTPSDAGADRHFVHRLWAVNLSDGSIALGGPALIGDTMITTANADTTNFTGYQYFAGPIVNGTGNNGTVNGSPVTDGWVPSSDPNHLNYDPDASGQIAFNALLHLNRPALTLLNGRIYIAFASHGDRGPYYGWILSYSASTLALTGAFVTAPTFTGIVGSPANWTAQAGVWMSGAKLATDGTYLYATDGNGAFNEANSNFDASGFPIDHNYGDCLMKLGVDPDSSPNNQNGNGWGIKVYDYFCPSNQFELNDVDADLGSSGVTILPDTASVTVDGVTYNHLLILGGKEGRIYLINRDNLGKLNLSFPKGETAAPFTDPRPFDEHLNGSGLPSGVGVLGEYQTNAFNDQTKRDYSSAVYFNGKFYLALSGNPAWSFNLSTYAGPGQPPAPTATTNNSNNLGARGPTISLSANGTSNAIVWLLSINGGSSTDNLLAYNASNMASLFNSNSTQPDGTTSNSLVSFGGGTDGVTFTVPTVINGMVYCGTGGPNTTTSGDPSDSRGSIVAYGLLSPTLTAPSNLNATAQSGTQIHLTWTRNSTSETMLRIERSPNGSNSWSPIAFVPNGATSFDDNSVGPGQHWYYRVAAISGPTTGAFSNVDDAFTTFTQVTASQFVYLTPPQHIEFTFNGDVSASLTVDDLILENLTTATTIPSGTIIGEWDAPTKTASFRFPILANGVYRATLVASGISGVEFGPMQSNSILNFFFVNGDIDRNGQVDVNDLGILATNWQLTPANYALGDLDYNNHVDVGDLGILASNWQYGLPGPLPSAPTPYRAARRTGGRVIELTDLSSTARAHTMG